MQKILINKSMFIPCTHRRGRHSCRRYETPIWLEYSDKELWMEYLKINEKGVEDTIVLSDYIEDVNNPTPTEPLYQKHSSVIINKSPSW